MTTVEKIWIFLRITLNSKQKTASNTTTLKSYENALSCTHHVALGRVLEVFGTWGLEKLLRGWNLVSCPVGTC